MFARRATDALLSRPIKTGLSRDALPRRDRPTLSKRCIREKRYRHVTDALPPRITKTKHSRVALPTRYHPTPTKLGVRRGRYRSVTIPRHQKNALATHYQGVTVLPHSNRAFARSVTDRSPTRYTPTSLFLGRYRHPVCLYKIIRGRGGAPEAFGCPRPFRTQIHAKVCSNVPSG